MPCTPASSTTLADKVTAFGAPPCRWLSAPCFHPLLLRFGVKDRRYLIQPPWRARVRLCCCVDRCIYALGGEGAIFRYGLDDQCVDVVASYPASTSRLLVRNDDTLVAFTQESPPQGLSRKAWLSARLPPLPTFPLSAYHINGTFYFTPFGTVCSRKPGDAEWQSLPNPPYPALQLVARARIGKLLVTKPLSSFPSHSPNIECLSEWMPWLRK